MRAMRCPYCSEHSDKVVDSRTAADGDAIRRRRECRSCGRRYTTYERLEPIALVVRKRSGTTQPFDQAKLARGIAQATAGRAVASDAVDTMADELAEWARTQGAQITSDALGLAVLERLRPLDPVSYLRFASVYKQFDDLADFEAEVVELQKASSTGAPEASGVPEMPAVLELRDLPPRESPEPERS